MSRKDYYETLSVNRNASPDEIKKSYRKLAREYHPDVSRHSDATDRFKEVQEAYDILKDPDKRAAYDRFGHAGVAGGVGGFGGGDPFSDLFSGIGGLGNIFDDFFGGGTRRSSRTAKRASRGHDLRAEVTATFEECATGTEKEMEVAREVRCIKCGGNGAEPGTSPISCPACHGTGMQQRSQGFFSISTTCRSCGGAGQIIVKKCEQCQGRGREIERRNLKVSIPAGIQDGMQMRLSGEGEEGEHGGFSGDLYVAVTIEPHEFFTRLNDDVHLNVTIDFASAIIGCKREVPTLFGPEEIAIPAGTQPLTDIRLKGNGFPNVHGRGKGDQVVTVQVELPVHLSRAQKDKLKKFSNSLESKNYPKESGFKKLLKKVFGIK